MSALDQIALSVVGLVVTAVNCGSLCTGNCLRDQYLCVFLDLRKGYCLWGRKEYRKFRPVALRHLVLNLYSILAPKRGWKELSLREVFSYSYINISL